MTNLVCDLFFIEGFMALVGLAAVGRDLPISLTALFRITHAHTIMEEVSHLRVELARLRRGATVLGIPLVQGMVMFQLRRS